MTRKWSDIELHFAEIDSIFFHYDVDKILSTPHSYFVEKLREIKCGNRNINEQMKNLPHNIAILKKLEEKHGSLDKFVTSAPAYEIVEILSNYSSEYKLKSMGEALCWEYLRNVGIDGIKPDVHVCRFLGSGRIGRDNSEIATAKEVINTASTLSKETGLLLTTIDNIIWSFCAEGYGNICGASPRCHECPITKYCNYVRHSQ